MQLLEEVGVSTVIITQCKGAFRVRVSTALMDLSCQLNRNDRRLEFSWPSVVTPLLWRMLV